MKMPNRYTADGFDITDSQGELQYLPLTKRGVREMCDHLNEQHDIITLREKELGVCDQAVRELKEKVHFFSGEDDGHTMVCKLDKLSIENAKLKKDNAELVFVSNEAITDSMALGLELATKIEKLEAAKDERAMAIAIEQKQDKIDKLEKGREND